MQFRYTNILYLDRDTGARFSGHFLFEVLGGQESQGLQDHRAEAWDLGMGTPLAALLAENWHKTPPRERNWYFDGKAKTWANSPPCGDEQGLAAVRGWSRCPAASSPFLVSPEHPASHRDTAGDRYAPPCSDQCKN